MSIPKVTVIVPNYNYEHFLRQRIDSILQQTYTDFELILLDDCSTDGSVTILAEYALHPKVSAFVVNQKNTGSPFLQWEKGISMAKGEYIWIAESDDFADITLLEKCVAALESYPEAVLARTGSYLVDKDGKCLNLDYDKWGDLNQLNYYTNDAYIKKRLFWRNDVYNASMVLFRRANYLQMDKKFTSMRYAGDWLFWLELLRTGSGAIEIGEKLNRFRQHTQRVTLNSTKQVDLYQELITIRKRIFTVCPTSIYRTYLVKGLIYKDFYRMEKLLDTPLLSAAQEELGVKKKHYYVERFRKMVGNLPFMKSYTH